MWLGRLKLLPPASRFGIKNAANWNYASEMKVYFTAISLQATQISAILRTCSIAWLLHISWVPWRACAFRRQKNLRSVRRAQLFDDDWNDWNGNEHWGTPNALFWEKWIKWTWYEPLASCNTQFNILFYQRRCLNTLRQYDLAMEKS